MPTDDAEPAVRVSENPAAHRFEAHVGEELAGVMEYVERPDGITATHTEVAERFTGQGVGSRLVAGVLDQLRADGRRMEPRCPYVAAYLRRHPEYDDIVDPVPSR